MWDVVPEEFPRDSDENSVGNVVGTFIGRNVSTSFKDGRLSIHKFSEHSVFSASSHNIRYVLK